MLNYLFNLNNSFDSFNSVYARMFIGFFLSLALSILFGGKLIEFLRSHQAKGQPIRETGPQSHLLTKKGTPTMGGLLILGSSIFSVLITANLFNAYVWVLLLVLVVYGIVGFIDDYVKVTKQT